MAKKSPARTTGFDAGIPLEVHNEVDGWLASRRSLPQTKAPS